MTTALPKATSECYDNTRVSGYKFCPRSYFIRHILNWKSEGTAMALVFGLSWHDGMDVVWRGAKKFNKDDLGTMAHLKFLETWEEWGLSPNPTLEQAHWWGARTPGTAAEMYHNYIDQRWDMMKDAILLAAEQPFAVPMPGFEDVWYIGRLDKSIQWGNQTIILEHKTTTSYATEGNFRSDYVDSWYSSPQVKGYQFGGGLFYAGLDGVWVDAALVHKKIHNAFKFIPVAHKFDLLTEWIADTGEWIHRIRRDIQSYNSEGKLVAGTFPKNEDNCYGKFGVCPFLNICRTTVDPSALTQVPPGYVEELWEPFSVLGLDKIVTGDQA